MGLRPNWVVPIHLDRSRDRALVGVVLRSSRTVFSNRSSAALHGDDQVHSRTFEDNPLKPVQEPLKYVTRLSGARGNRGFPEKASEIG